MSEEETKKKKNEKKIKGAKRCADYKQEQDPTLFKNKKKKIREYYDAITQ